MALPAALPEDDAGFPDRLVDGYRSLLSGRFTD